MNKRDARYEYIRVISMLLVIGTHAFATISPTYAEASIAGKILQLVLFLCNGLFFMISGKFALNVCCRTNEDYRVYYLKRLGSIGIPVLIGMLLRTMFNSGWWVPYMRSADFLRDYIRNVLGDFSTCEYWFLYTLVGFLAAAPFIGKLLQQASKTDLCWLIGICLFWNAWDNYLPVFGLPFQWKFPLGGWFVLFILGYGVERLVETEREEKILLLLGALSFAVSILLMGSRLDRGIADMAPTYAVMVSAVFVLLKKLYRPGKRVDAVVLAVGKLTMPVYLLHMIVLYTLLPYIPQWPFPVRAVALWALTTVTTLLAACILDKVLLCGLQRLYRKGMRLR